MDRSDSINDRTRSRWLRRAAFPTLFVALLGIGIVPRLEGRTALRRQTTAYAEPTVAVVHPTPGARVQQLKLPANVQPYATTWIYARTDGYLAHWYADIGTHVGAGQRLADIAAPEIDAELQQA